MGHLGWLVLGAPLALSLACGGGGGASPGGAGNGASGAPAATAGRGGGSGESGGVAGSSQAGSAGFGGSSERGGASGAAGLGGGSAGTSGATGATSGGAAGAGGSVTSGGSGGASSGGSGGSGGSPPACMGPAPYQAQTCLQYGDGQATCVDGACVSCPNAWAYYDCDGDPANGCETVPSVEHCGACSRKCGPLQKCVGWVTQAGYFVAHCVAK